MPAGVTYFARGVSALKYLPSGTRSAKSHIILNLYIDTSQENERSKRKFHVLEESLGGLI